MPPKTDGVAAYEAQKSRAAARNSSISAAGRDIGDLPPVADPERRKACRTDFRLFCETYFPASFSLAWSPDHLEVIAKIEETAIRGGRFALAMPRGSGKTTLCEAGTAWVMLYAHRRFPVVIGSDASSAAEIMDSIKIEIETNELLAEDFPEVCYPIAKLEGITQRASGQHQGGEPTRIVWSADEIVLPTIKGAATSGIILRIAGITGRIRGMKHKAADGTNRRPDYVLIDDPQTDESARSPSQCANRERIITRAVLNLAGPGEKIAAFMPTTVIVQGDMADRVLDPTIHPNWQGKRMKMLKSLPTNEKLWEQYDELRRDCLTRTGSIEEATRFYAERRAEMDEGAEASWKERYEPDELSAIQHAMNKKLEDPYSFAAEFQNEPIDPGELDAAASITAEGVIEKAVKSPAGVVPPWATKLTSFVDVQGESLWWMVCAWGDGFTGVILDYGVFPEQPTKYFSLREITRTLSRRFPGFGPEAAIRAGLDEVEGLTVARDWPTEHDGDGPAPTLRVSRAAVDSGWGFSTETVYEYTRRSNHKSVLMPAKGMGVTASSIPMNEYRRKPGERTGMNWRITTPGDQRVRRLLYDTNYWKSFVHARLAAPVGERGTLTIAGERPGDHRLLADHLTSEYFVRTSGRGREVDVWSQRADRPDNHWFDCLVGCAALAATEGISLDGVDGPKPRAKRKVKLSERKAQREARR